MSLQNASILTTFFPVMHYCQWCKGTHYGACPQSLAPALDDLSTQVGHLQSKVIELEELLQYLNSKVNRHKRMSNSQIKSLRQTLRQGDTPCPGAPKRRRR